MLTLDNVSKKHSVKNVKEVTTGDKAGIQRLFLCSRHGNKVYFKPENMQFTGAYKVRGAYYKISTLSHEEACTGPDHRICRATMPRALPMQQKPAGVQGNHRHADHHTPDQGEPHQGLRRRSRPLRRCLSTRHVSMHTSWRRRRDIPLSIRSMIWKWQPARAPLPWRSSRNCPTVDYILVPDRRRRTGVQVFPPWQSF